MSVNASACPVAHDVDLMDPEFLSVPFPYLSEMRLQTPVFYAPEVNLYFVTRYSDTEQIFLDRDTTTYSAGNASSPVWAPCPAAAEVLKAVPLIPTLNNADPPRHGYMRTAVLKGLTPRRIAAMEPVLRRITEELVDRLVEQPVADLMSGLAVPLPGYAGFSLLGFPEADWDMVKAWCRGRVQLTYGRLPDDEQLQVAQTVVSFWNYCEEHVALREREPGNDMTTELIEYASRQPDEEMSRLDVVRIVYALALAGHDSTTAAIGGGLRYLIGNPDQWAMVVADRALIPKAVEEMLRFDPPILGQRRIALRDIEIGGVSIPAGSQLMLTVASAHRDEEKFENPDVFDVTREGARAHLSFGKGAHLCLGAPLARLEMKVMLEVLADRLPGMRLVPEQDIRVVPNLVFRNLERLLVETSPAGG
jgi:cytochrome P450